MDSESEVTGTPRTSCLNWFFKSGARGTRYATRTSVRVGTGWPAAPPGAASLTPGSQRSRVRRLRRQARRAGPPAPPGRPGSQPASGRHSVHGISAPSLSPTTSHSGPLGRRRGRPRAGADVAVTVTLAPRPPGRPAAPQPPQTHDDASSVYTCEPSRWTDWSRRHPSPGAVASRRGL